MNTCGKAKRTKTARAMALGVLLAMAAQGAAAIDLTNVDALELRGDGEPTEPKATEIQATKAADVVEKVQEWQLREAKIQDDLKTWTEAHYETSVKAWVVTPKYRRNTTWSLATTSSDDLCMQGDAANPDPTGAVYHYAWLLLVPGTESSPQWTSAADQLC